MIEWTKSTFEVVVTSYGRNKKFDDEIKNIAGQVLTYNSKNFPWLTKKLDLEKTRNELGKPFLKKSEKKQNKTENQCQNDASENKNH